MIDLARHRHQLIQSQAIDQLVFRQPSYGWYVVLASIRSSAHCRQFLERDGSGRGIDR
jgi:hypothetical protein